MHMTVLAFPDYVENASLLRFVSEALAEAIGMTPWLSQLDRKAANDNARRRFRIVCRSHPATESDAST